MATITFAHDLPKNISNPAISRVHAMEAALIESMRNLEAAAKARKLPFELATYPEAEHAFDSINASQYRPAHASDAWSRTTDMLFERHPVNTKQ
jgi:dienelactone hydrolase